MPPLYTAHPTPHQCQLNGVAITAARVPKMAVPKKRGCSRRMEALVSIRKLVGHISLPIPSWSSSIQSGFAPRKAATQGLCSVYAAWTSWEKNGTMFLCVAQLDISKNLNTVRHKQRANTKLTAVLVSMLQQHTMQTRTGQRRDVTDHWPQVAAESPIVSHLDDRFGEGWSMPCMLGGSHSVR